MNNDIEPHLPASLEGLTPEDAARTSYYSLVARLFIAPLDELTIAQLRQYAQSLAAIDESQLAQLDLAGRSLHQAMLVLCQAACAQELDALQLEFTELFHSDISLNATSYTGTPIAPLQQWLDDSSVAIDTHSLGQREDHVSLLAQTMVFLIMQTDVAQQDRVEMQADLFARFIGNWTPQLWAAIDQHPSSAFYRHAAAYALAFYTIERTQLLQAF